MSEQPLSEPQRAPIDAQPQDLGGPSTPDTLGYAVDPTTFPAGSSSSRVGLRSHRLFVWSMATLAAIGALVVIAGAGTFALLMVFGSAR